MADGIEKLADKVRTRLEEMDRNQAWLADQLGTSPSQISKWLGDGNQPSHPYLLRLSKTLNVSINYLVDDDQEITTGMPTANDPDSAVVNYMVKILGPAESARRLTKAYEVRTIETDEETYGSQKRKNPPMKGRAGN